MDKLSDYQFKIIYLTMLVGIVAMGCIALYFWMTERQLYAVLLGLPVLIGIASIKSEASSRHAAEMAARYIEQGQQQSNETIKATINALVQNDKQDVEEMKVFKDLFMEMSRTIREREDRDAKASDDDDSVPPWMQNGSVPYAQQPQANGHDKVEQ